MQHFSDSPPCAGCCRRLQELRKHADDAAFQKRWQEVKQQAKSKSIALIERLTGVPLANKAAMLDVQVKRIHEVGGWLGGRVGGC